jgi:GntR family transcriptional repressor for pyruvate dehydrogenase complex
MEIFNIDDKNILKVRQKESSVDIVIENIKRLLIAKRLVRGDKIPNEGKLSEVMSVSRGTIREAMKILAAFKIIDIRRGDGTYISTSINNTIFDPLLFNLIISESEINELVELRELFEIGLAKLVIKNADKDDLDNIFKACSEMKNCVKYNKKNSEVLLKCDMDFHYALGRATKNILVAKIYDFIMDFFKPKIQAALKSKDSAKRALKMHNDIYEALCKKDFKKVTKSIKFSIEEWKKALSC